MFNLPGCMVLPQESPKFSRLEKFRFDKSDTDISDMIIEYCDRGKRCQNWYFKQLISE